MLRLKSFVLLLLFFFQPVAPVLAQEGQKRVLVDADFLRAAEIAIAERDKLRVQSEAKDEVIAGKDSQIAALRALLQLERDISKSWMESATARKNALTIDDRLIKQYDDQIGKLTTERDKARAANKWWGCAGMVLGALAGAAAAK